MAILSEALKVDNSACGNVAGLNTDRDGGRLGDREFLSGQAHAFNTLDSNRRRPIRGEEKTERFALENVAAIQCSGEAVSSELKSDLAVGAVGLTSPRFN
jgi:hypothetical protein